MQDNPIKRLPGFAFAGLRNITELHLGYNKLEKIDGYVKSRLHKKANLKNSFSMNKHYYDLKYN